MNHLESRLTRHRRRLVLRTFLRTLALALACTMPLAGVLLALAAWVDWGIQAGPIVLSMLALALAVAGTGLLFSDTSLKRTARLLEADNPLLHARLSTALELRGTEQAESAVVRAQLRDAISHADSLVPSQRIRLQLPATLRNSLLAGTFVLAAGALLNQSLFSLPRHALVQSGTQHDRFTDDEQARLSSGLQQLAEIFSQVGEADSDPYLEAISRQLQELGQRMEDPRVSREQVSSELERLLQHTRTALELQNPERSATGMEQLPELLEAALRDVNQGQFAQELIDDQSSEVADLPLPEGMLNAAGDQFELEASQPPTLQEMLQAGEQLDTGEGGSQAASPNQARSSGSYYDAAIDERTIAELNARAMDAASQAAGQAIGASPESQAGASSMAGEGTDELFGAQEAARLNAELLEQMAVPEETDPDGRHVRIEVTPEAELTEVRMTPLGQMSWSRQPENQVEREPILTEQRLITARFHTPGQDE